MPAEVVGQPDKVGLLQKTGKHSFCTRCDAKEHERAFSMQDWGRRPIYGDRGAAHSAVQPKMAKPRARPSRLEATPSVSGHSHADTRLSAEFSHKGRHRSAACFVLQCRGK